MVCVILPSKRFMRSRRKRLLTLKSFHALLSETLLLNSDLRDEAEHVIAEDVVEFAFVFFLEAFAQEFGGDETGFAVSEVASGFIAKRGERGVGEADDASVAIIVEKEFGINCIGVARG